MVGSKISVVSGFFQFLTSFALVVGFALDLDSVVNARRRAVFLRRQGLLEEVLGVLANLVCATKLDVQAVAIRVEHHHLCDLAVLDGHADTSEAQLVLEVHALDSIAFADYFRVQIGVPLVELKILEASFASATFEECVRGVKCCIVDVLVDLTLIK